MFSKNIILALIVKQNFLEGENAYILNCVQNCPSYLESNLNVAIATDYFQKPSTVYSRPNSGNNRMCCSVLVLIDAVSQNYRPTISDSLHSSSGMSACMVYF